MHKTLGLWIWEAVECCKCGLMGRPSRSLERCADIMQIVDCRGSAQGAAEGKENNIRNWARNHSYNVLSKNVTLFSTLILKICWVLSRKLSLSSLAKISRQPIIYSLCIWLLVITQMQIYNEKGKHG